jgi:glycosyltransferase domain-containing protein
MPEVAIVVPTLNRSVFVERLLKYYVSVSSKHPIYIGEGGNRESDDVIRKFIPNYSGKLNIKYFYLPGTNVSEAIYKLVEKVTEQFCAFIGDDDFLFPSGLEECGAFLSNNSEFRTAQGRSFSFSLNNSGAHGNISGLGDYWGKPCAEEDGVIKRLLQYSNQYWVSLFSVHRTNELLFDIAEYPVMKDQRFIELAACFKSIAGGKSKFIDVNYLARTTHDQRYLQPGIEAWIAGNDWCSSRELFSKSIIDVLNNKHNIPIDDAIFIEKNMFTNFLKLSFLQKKNGVFRISLEFIKKKCNFFYKVYRNHKIKILIKEKLSNDELNSLRKILIGSE